MQRVFSSLDRNGNVINVVKDLPSIGKIPQKKVWDPMGLPADSKQCVHVEWQNDPKTDANYLYRCVKPSTKGFLCGFHDYNVIDLPRRTRYPLLGRFITSWGTLSRRDFDQEHIDQILKTEKEALFVEYTHEDGNVELVTIEREVVRLSAKGAKIQFVKDLRMSSDLRDITEDDLIKWVSGEGY